MPTKSNTSYFTAIGQALSTTLKGAQLTLTHIKDAVVKPKVPNVYASEEKYFEKSNKGAVTLRYPFEELPVPQNGRYQLHNEIDDCIVCDKCAKVCPVDCIDIEPVKSTEVIGHTSDGTAKRLYAAKFDIDMAKCCFCGLCTTVCPTECLTMTDDYDFSTYNVGDMNFGFSEMTPEEAAEKERIYEAAQAKKKEAALAAKKAKAEQETSTAEKPKAKRPAFKPKVGVKKTTQETNSEEPKADKPKRPAFRPKIKAKTTTEQAKEDHNIAQSDSQEKEVPTTKKRPVFKPRMKAKPTSTEELTPTEESKTEDHQEESPSADKKPIRPKFKPRMKPPKKED